MNTELIDIEAISIVKPESHNEPSEAEWAENDRYLAAKYKEWGSIDVWKTFRDSKIRINPTREEVRSVCRKHGITPPPWPPPKEGWRSSAFMASDRAAIIAANPLVDYVRARNVELKQEGNRWKCLCLVHEEKSPSFYIGPDPNVWHCFGCGAGGSVIDLHAALNGITIAEAMAEFSHRDEPPKLVEVAAYKYQDESGRDIFEVARFAPKDFRQFRLDEHGQRIWKGGMTGVRKVPYHLPEVLSASEVFICEGEKDADTLKRIGYVATTNPGGAGKWKSEYSQFFKGKIVYIVPDRDEPGRKHGEQVAQTLTDAAEAVLWLDLPDGVKDPADLAQAEGSQFRARFDALLARARRVEFSDNDEPPDDPRDFRKSEPSPEECGIPGESKMQKGANNEKIEVPVGKPLLDYVNTPPRPEDTLFGRRWLCRKGTAMLIGPSGLGKTALVLQGSFHWGAKLSFLGIEPERPLKIAIFGCEDDEGDIHEIVRDACRELNLSAEQEALVRENVRYYHHMETSGLLFLRQIVEPILARDKPDLVIINPLQGYLGGNIQDAALTGSFVRNTLLPILNKHNAAAIIVHHTPKTNYRNTDKWTFMDWQYSAQGGADLTNAMRAILVLEPTKKLGVFRLMGPKRGHRLGWVDEFDNATLQQHIAWKDPDSSSIWWRLATDDEIAGANDEQSKSSTRKAPADKALELVPDEGVDKQIFKQRIMARFNVSVRTADQVFNELFANDQIHEVPFKRSGKPPGKLVKRGPLPEQELVPVAASDGDETAPRKPTEEDALDVLRDGMKTQEWQKACYHERNINRTDFHTFKRSIVAKGLASQNGPEERWSATASK